MSAAEIIKDRMPLDWKSGALATGLDCYQNRKFFEAHEHWENVWLQLEEPEKSLLQALIQITAAFHHFQVGNPAGTASLLRRALRRLELCPASGGGVVTELLCREVRAWLRALESGDTVPGSFPKICLEQ